MRFYPILCLLILACACGAKKSPSAKIGETKSHVIVTMGEPISETTIPVPDSTVATFKDNTKVQFKNDIAVASFTDPKGDEKSVQWWRHKLKNCLTTNKSLPHSTDLHTAPEWELTCASEGLSIIYNEGSDFVIRVVEVEKK